MTSRFKYAFYAALWLLAGLLTWRYAGGLLRSLGGDVLVTGFLFWTLMFLFPTNNTFKTMIAVFSFASGLEFLQLFKVGEILMPNETLRSLLLGSTFDWLDIPGYALGLIICIPLVQQNKPERQSE